MDGDLDKQRKIVVGGKGVLGNLTGEGDKEVGEMFGVVVVGVLPQLGVYLHLVNSKDVLEQLTK